MVAPCIYTTYLLLYYGALTYCGINDFHFFCFLVLYYVWLSYLGEEHPFLSQSEHYTAWVVGL